MALDDVSEKVSIVTKGEWVLMVSYNNVIGKVKFKNLLCVFYVSDRLIISKVSESII